MNVGVAKVMAECIRRECFYVLSGFTVGRKDNKVIIITMPSVFAPYLTNLGTLE